MKGKMVLGTLYGLLSLWIMGVNAFNVTQVLESRPEFSTLNALLTQAGLGVQINSRNTITLLAPPNSILDPVVQQLSSQLTPESVFYILSFHVLLDFYDLAKIGSLPNSTTLTSSLYQTTGPANALDGYVNITNLGNGRIRAGPASPPNGPLTVNITRDVYMESSNFSVLEIDGVLVPPGVLSSNASAPSPAATAVNLTQLITTAGNFSTFLTLAQSLSVLPVLENRTVAPGQTVFIPTDAAFASLPPNALDPLTDQQKVQILAYHVIPAFYSTETLGSLEGQPIMTLASSGGGFTFTINRNGSALAISTGVNMVTVGNSFYANNPVSLFSIDAVLLPSDIFGSVTQSPSMAPTGAPMSTSGPSPSLGSDGTPLPSVMGPSSMGGGMTPDSAKASSLSCLGGGALLALLAYLF